MADTGTDTDTDTDTSADVANVAGAVAAIAGLRYYIQERANDGERWNAEDDRWMSSRLDLIEKILWGWSPRNSRQKEGK